MPHNRDRRNNEDSIEARLRLAAIVESSEDAIFSKSLDGIITSWNAGATQLLGYSEEEIVGKSVLTIVPADLHAEEAEILSRLRAGERIDHYETQRLHKEGRRVHLSVTISPIRDENGNVVGISNISRDLTEKRRTEAALIESERLAEIGRMAASISHEVNNPLESILNLAFILQHHSSLDAEGKEYARILIDEVHRVSEITKQTLSFYRDTTAMQEVNLVEIMEMVLKLHRSRFLRKSIRVITRYREPVTMMGRAGDLRQVFLNLVLNAVDALPDEGTLMIRLCSNTSKNVCVTVADNGSGIPELHRIRIFEPFFTTKEGTGTGLGLWVCQNIVKKYGGQLRMWSRCEPGRSGTTFRAQLPSNLILKAS